VIDLTNTTRYYSPAEWTKQGTKHVKIPCKGRDAVPDNESVNMFVYEVTPVYGIWIHLSPKAVSLLWMLYVYAPPPGWVVGTREA